MKVFLTADVAGQGKKGEIVEVNDSYARNYLIPRKLGVEATKNVLNEYTQRQEKEAKQAQKEKDEAMELRRQLDGTTITVSVRCGGGKMYGSVTSQDVADALAAKGFSVDKKKISIKDTIKTTGIYDVEVRVYKETVAKLKINVVATESK